MANKAKAKVSPQFKRLCTRFGRILGGESEVENGRFVLSCCLQIFEKQSWEDERFPL